jgi:hypothetical protein
MRCPVCGVEDHACTGETAAMSGTPIDIPTRRIPVANPGPLVKVRTGPTSYLKMTEAEAAKYREQYGEYGVDQSDAQPAQRTAETIEIELPATVQELLLAHYADLDAVRTASDEELLAIEGIGDGRLKQIRQALGGDALAES